MLEFREHERRHLGENDSLVLEVEDLDDEWSQAGFPRASVLSQRRTKRMCLAVLAVMALCLGGRQISLWFNGEASSNNVPSSLEPKHTTNTAPDPNPSKTTSPTALPTAAEPVVPSTPSRPTKSPMTAPTPPNPTSPSDSQTTEATIGPFSVLDPVADLGLWTIDRPDASRPPRTMLKLQERNQALPTNAWYQNLLLVQDSPPSSINRAYVMPHVVDAAGPLPGLRVIPNRLQVGDSTEVIAQENFGITLGMTSHNDEGSSSAVLDHSYMVQDATQLAVTLEWVSHVFVFDSTKIID